MQIRELVSAEVFDRYDHQLLESMIMAMPNLVRCPRKHCNNILKQNFYRLNGTVFID
jgi:hypothetical protein